MSRTRLAVAAIVVAIGVLSLAALSATAFPLRTVAASPVIGPQEDDVVRIGGDVKPPRKIKDVKPVYPEDAKEAGIEGVVIIEAVINKEGLVAEAKVLRSVPELDQSAVDAVLQWEFEPTYVKGKAVSVRMTITVNFTLA